MVENVRPVEFSVLQRLWLCNIGYSILFISISVIIEYLSRTPGSSRVHVNICLSSNGLQNIDFMILVYYGFVTFYVLYWFYVDFCGGRKCTISISNGNYFQIGMSKLLCMQSVSVGDSCKCVNGVINVIYATYTICKLQFKFQYCFAWGNKCFVWFTKGRA